MGHEVAHATARHGSEHLAQQLAALVGLSAVYRYMNNNTEPNEETRGVIIGAVGVGPKVGFVLPFSRTHQKEADVIGMMYMARAGYPPAESVAVWNRMDKMSGGGPILLFLSTHPSHGQRKHTLQDWMPQARKRDQRNARAEHTQRTLWTAQHTRVDRPPPPSGGCCRRGAAVSRPVDSAPSFTGTHASGPEAIGW